MGLVDYSDSESETETVAKPAPPPQHPPTASGSKKPFQKVVDRSKPGKILVSLPKSSSGRQDSGNAATNGDGPPAKRARITKGGAFSGFNSFLPPPKNVGKTSASSVASASSSSGATKGTNPPRPGVHLKTGAAPGFSRDVDGQGDADTDGDGGMRLPEPRSQQPSIPAGQKPADDVELVGKPLMFKPLSVSRKKLAKKVAAKSTVPVATLSAPTSATPETEGSAAKLEPPPKKKVSLFFVPDETPDIPESRDASHDEYEPIMATGSTDMSSADAFAAYDAQYNSYAAPSQAASAPSTNYATANSLDSIASDMNLSAAARRELFGRGGAPNASVAASRVINFNTEKEYAHNEELRASGEQQVHNPLRAIAPGKHNLRQLVNQVQTQRDALEESFAQGKSKQNDAGSRYGWR
ncbi:mitotic checkpoint regulator, MAD2B-interacting-domain-containing protein [Astrocystis sublimbata]|nr:mitotic checkpoint regulator, MAD2B-interacting-domain-containing protein [Astrocystis sublimbata]